MNPSGRGRLAEKVGLGFLYVLGASLFGLASAMAFGGFALMGKVWGASVGGDLVFTLGMVAVGGSAFGLASRGRSFVGGLIGALGAWVVYALSWSITDPALGTANSEHWAVSLGQSWGFTFGWGWPGLVFSGVAPVMAAWRQRATASSPSHRKGRVYGSPAGPADAPPRDQ